MSPKKQAEGCELICISASPGLLLSPIMSELQLKRLIGSIFKTNQNGQIIPVMTSKNCKGIEKINRLNASFKKSYFIQCFYSDHKSDLPLFKLAKHKFLVTNGDVNPCKICIASGKLYTKNND
ncbi:MAG: haloacid dehalogenase-like hydrolase [Candidatus Margulisiibacteriota bacterium]